MGGRKWIVSMATSRGENGRGRIGVGFEYGRGREIVVVVGKEGGEGVWIVATSL